MHHVTGGFGHFAQPLAVAAARIQFAGHHSQLPVPDVIFGIQTVFIAEAENARFIRCDLHGADAGVGGVQVALHFRPDLLPDAHQSGAVGHLAQARERQLFIGSKVLNAILAAFIPQGRQAVIGIQMGAPDRHGSVRFRENQLGVRDPVHIGAQQQDRRVAFAAVKDFRLFIAPGLRVPGSAVHGKGRESLRGYDAEQLAFRPDDVLGIDLQQEGQIRAQLGRGFLHEGKGIRSLLCFAKVCRSEKPGRFHHALPEDHQRGILGVFDRRFHFRGVRGGRRFRRFGGGFRGCCGRCCGGGFGRRCLRPLCLTLPVGLGCAATKQQAADQQQRADNAPKAPVCCGIFAHQTFLLIGLTVIFGKRHG